MKQAQKSMFMGVLLTAAVLVFLPDTYVWISQKVGKLARVQEVQ